MGYFQIIERLNVADTRIQKMEQTQEMNMTNKVNIEFLREQLDKALADIEALKDKVRENGAHQ